MEAIELIKKQLEQKRQEVKYLEDALSAMIKALGFNGESIATANTKKANTIGHQRYPTLEDAKQAQHEYKTVQTQKETYSAKLTSPPVKRLPSFEKPRSILTAQGIEYPKKITEEKFLSLYTNLFNYQEHHKKYSFYPTDRKKFGPKAIILPEASAFTTYEYFYAGLTDCIYTRRDKFSMFRFFPQYFRGALSKYDEKKAKGREIFLKTYSIYPIFKEGEIQQKAISAISVGISNSEYTPLTVPEEQPITDENLTTYFINNYVGLCEQLQKIKVQTRINCKSVNILMFSSHPGSEISESQKKVLVGFKKTVVNLEVIPEEKEKLKEELCGRTRKVDNHCCSLCTREEKEDSSERFIEDNDSIKIRKRSPMPRPQGIVGSKRQKM